MSERRRPAVVATITSGPVELHPQLPWTRKWFLRLVLTVNGKRKVEYENRFKRSEDSAAARAFIIYLLNALAPGAVIRERRAKR